MKAAISGRGFVVSRKKESCGKRDKEWKVRNGITGRLIYIHEGMNGMTRSEKYIWSTRLFVFCVSIRHQSDGY